MVPLRFIRSTHDEFGARRIPDRRILTGLPVRWSVLLANEPARLVLEPVESAMSELSFIQSSHVVRCGCRCLSLVRNLFDARELLRTPNVHPEHPERCVTTFAGNSTGTTRGTDRKWPYLLFGHPRDKIEEGKQLPFRMV